jgi:Raf kinase inhibitor-like YbhB/YbcL family protein
MKLKVTALLCCLGILWCGATSCGSTATDGGVPTNLQSDDIPGTVIASTFVQAACGGDDLSPQLYWNYIPAAAKSLAITVLDDSASDFVHWILYNVPAATLELARGTAIPAGAVEATNDYGIVGYSGPCPPSGDIHFYKFKIWVLNIADLADAEGFDASDNGTILQALSDHETRTDEFQSGYRAP